MVSDAWILESLLSALGEGSKVEYNTVCPQITNLKAPSPRPMTRTMLTTIGLGMLVLGVIMTMWNLVPGLVPLRSQQLRESN